MRTMIRHGIGLVVGLLLSAGTCFSADFPTQRISLVIPFPAGGQTDVLARLIGNNLTETWKQPVIVENRPGAGGLIGADAVRRAAPDGHTVLMSANAIVTYKLFVKDMQFDPLATLKPVTQLVWSPLMMIVPAEVPAKTLQEFIAFVKAKPGAYNYGTFSFSSYDLDMSRFLQLTGIQMAPIAYNGGAPALTALLRNEIQMTFGAPSQSASQVAAGKLNAIAMAGGSRDRQRPGIPTLKEQGVDFELGAWYGLFVPSSTPDVVVAQIYRDVGAAMNVPATRSRIEEIGFDIVGSSPAQFAAKVGAEATTYAATARSLNIQPR